MATNLTILTFRLDEGAMKNDLVVGWYFYNRFEYENKKYIIILKNNIYIKIPQIVLIALDNAVLQHK